jgi:hypothetical protein
MNNISQHDLELTTKAREIAIITGNLPDEYDGYPRLLTYTIMSYADEPPTYGELLRNLCGRGYDEGAITEALKFLTERGVLLQKQTGVCDINLEGLRKAVRKHMNYQALSQLERAVLTSLKNPKTIHDLVNLMAADTETMQHALFNLISRGLVRENYRTSGPCTYSATLPE